MQHFAMHADEAYGGATRTLSYFGLTGRCNLAKRLSESDSCLEKRSSGDERIWGAAMESSAMQSAQESLDRPACWPCA